MASPSDNNTVLVALLKDPKDWHIVLEHGIYRIRGSLRYPPPMLTEKRVKLVAFYLPSKFKAYKFSVRHYAIVKNITMAPRLACLPDEPRNAKSNDLYYKFDLEEPLRLNEPIVSLRGRAHMVLIPTTENLFFNAQEFNFLYHSTKLEEKMWKALLDRNIFPEREYPVHTRDDSAYRLDFAVFCKNGRFGIEVDGPHHEASRKAVVDDKRRDNKLSVEKWDVRRYVPEDLEIGTLPGTLQQIEHKIKSLEGLDTVGGLLPARPKSDISGQLPLFHEAHLDFLELRRRVREKYEKP